MFYVVVHDLRMGCLGLLLVAGRKEGGVEKDGAGEEVGKEGERKEMKEMKARRTELREGTK